MIGTVYIIIQGKIFMSLEQKKRETHFLMQILIASVVRCASSSLLPSICLELKIADIVLGIGKDVISFMIIRDLDLIYKVTPSL